MLEGRASSQHDGHVADADDDVLAGLVAAAAEGDDVAFGELVRATQDVVWRLCSALGSRGEEEDLVQETYLRAVRSIDRYRGEAPVRVWLLAIARNVCADHVRRRQRRRRLIERAIHFSDRHTLHAADATPDLTGDLLDVLDPDRKAAFVATQVLGLSYEDAATVLGCPIGTIRSRVARARGQLLAAVEQSEAQ